MQRVTNLGDYRRAKSTPTPIKVERFPDPDFANRTNYIISSASAAAVQSYIFSLEAEIESQGNGNGYINFDVPRLCNGFYYAAGSVVVFPDVFDRSNKP